MRTLGERLSSAGQRAGLTQDALAKKAGITRVAISKAEQGLTKSFNGDTLLKVATALNCSPQWLQNGEEQSVNWENNVKSCPQKTHFIPILLLTGSSRTILYCWR